VLLLILNRHTQCLFSNKIKEVKSMRARLFILFNLIFINCLISQEFCSFGEYDFKLNKIKGIEICDFVEKNNIPFEQMMITEEIIVEKELGGRFHRGLNNIDLELLFNSESIECVNYTTANGYDIFKINYENKKEFLNAYKFIKQINKKEDYILKYDDFFKRGLVFILEKEKIIMISYNPFADNSLPKKLKNHFSENNKKYDKVLMSTSITSIKEL